MSALASSAFLALHMAGHPSRAILKRYPWAHLPWRSFILIVAAVLCRRSISATAVRLLADFIHLLRGLASGSRSAISNGRVDDAAETSACGKQLQPAAQHWAPSLLRRVGRPEFSGLSHKCLDNLRAGVDNFASNTSNVGPSLCAVVVDGAIPFLHRAGCDWVESSLFRIYSLTKPIFAVAFLTLSDRGLVCLDDPVSNYLPCFGNIKVLGTRYRQRVEMFEQVQRLLFDTRRSAKMLDAARSRGALREGGWLKLSFILGKRGGLREEDAWAVLKGVSAVELQVDRNGCRWARRSGQLDLPDLRELSGEPDLEEPRQPITLRMLLTHTAGLGYDFSLYRPPTTLTHKHYSTVAKDVQDGAIPDLARWVERIAEIPLLFHPGEKFSYGYSFDALGHVAERVTGMGLDKFLQQAVLGPLAMHDTSFAVPLSEVGRLVPLRRHKQCVFREATRDVPLDVGDSWSRWAEGRSSPVLSAGGAVESVAGGLVSSLRDYVSFVEMLLRRGAAPDGSQILRPETVEMAVDGRQLALATGGVVHTSFPGRSFSPLGEVIGPRTSGAGLVSWGGTAGTHFGVHLEQRYAIVFFAQSFGAPKVKGLFEEHLCPEFEQ